MALLKLFKRKYIVRRFGEDKIIEGYSHSTYNDIEVSLNVQPLSKEDLRALPEGERTTKRIKAYGDFDFTAADQANEKRGDWLLYYNRWYECVSAVVWDHTTLSHCESEFVEIAASETAPYAAISDPSGRTESDCK